MTYYAWRVRYETPMKYPCERVFVSNDLITIIIELKKDNYTINQIDNLGDAEVI